MPVYTAACLSNPSKHVAFVSSVSAFTTCELAFRIWALVCGYGLRAPIPLSRPELARSTNLTHKQQKRVLMHEHYGAHTRRLGAKV